MGSDLVEFQGKIVIGRPVLIVGSFTNGPDPDGLFQQVDEVAQKLFLFFLAHFG